jgi:transposase-like protein
MADPSVASGRCCPTCGCDLAGVPARRGQVACPACGRTTRAAARRRRAALPSCRCETCGYELAGLNAKNPLDPRVRCPECGARFNLTFASRLQDWPGDLAARRRMVAYTPYGMGVFALLAVLVYAWSRGTAGAPAYFAALGVAFALTLGEALVQAWRLAHGCFGRREALGKFAELAAIGAGLTMALWLPLALVMVAAAIVL